MTSLAMRAPAPGVTDDVTFDADLEVVARTTARVSWCTAVSSSDRSRMPRKHRKTHLFERSEVAAAPGASRRSGPGCSASVLTVDAGDISAIDVCGDDVAH